MGAREDHLALLIRNERVMDALRREFAERATAIVERHTARTGQFDALALLRTQQDMELLYTEFYGAFPGDERARFMQAILSETKNARRLAFRRSAQLVDQLIPKMPTLRRILKEGPDG